MSDQFNYPAPVPFHNEVANSFDGSYSFGGRLDPLTLPNAPLFSHDDFFNSFSNMNLAMAKMNKAFRDDMSSSFNNMLRSPSFGSSMLQPVQFGSFPDIANIGSSAVAALQSDPNALTHSHQMTQVMSYSNVDGKPKLIQSHDEQELGPYGLRRTRKAHRNTAKGIEKMQEGRFIDNRGEVRERYRNPRSKQYQQELYYKNLAPPEQPHFATKWNQEAERARRAFNLPIHRVDGPRQLEHHPYYYQQPKSIEH